MIDLKRTLDIILEEEPASVWHSFAAAMDIAQKLQDAHQLVADLQHRLDGIKRRMSSDLALGLRRAKPSLNVALDKTGCKVGYKTKFLLFVPDIGQEIWRVTSSHARFGREFLKAHSRATLLSQDLTVLITAVTDYFTNYYRTLGEELSGTGLLLVEERRATLHDVVNWREVYRPLNSRQMRPAKC